MRIRFLFVGAITCLLMGLSASNAHALVPVSWEDLKDPAAQQFEDPYAALTGFELRSLGKVLRLRKHLSGGGLPVPDRQEMERDLASEEAKLAAAGVQTDLLLAQREAVGRQRVKAALAGNTALAGQDIAISGYVIPVLDESGAARSGYLVPEFGMCSHMPAPDPNQMIHYKLSADWRAAEMYKPVVLTGRLGLAVTRQTITLLDGYVEMIAAFEMEVTDLRPIEDEPPKTAGGSIKDRIFRFFRSDR